MADPARDTLNSSDRRMHGTRPGRPASLPTALAACASSFAEFASADLRNCPFMDVDAKWTAHYHGPFAELDRQIRDCADAAARAALLPLSIAHHNLDRLFEVLQLDVQGPTLESARVPERVLDLQAAIARVGDEIDRASGPTVATQAMPISRPEALTPVS